MGTLPRSWSRRRATSLAAAALGAALTAAIVARRRAGARPVRPPTSSPTRADAAYAPEDADGATPHVAGTGPIGIGTRSAVEDGPRVDPPVRETAGDESDTVPSRPTSAWGRTRVVAVGLALVGALATGLGLITVGRDDDQPAADVEASVTTSVEPTTTTAIDDVSPQEAFAQAADRLVSSGSFGYVGTTSAIDVSHVRPGLWLAVDLTVEGDVMTSAERVHEIAVDDSGRATETVSEGPVVWGRLAPSREALPGATYLPITEESGVQSAGKGVALLPAWLDATVDRRDTGTDERGNRVLRARLPANVLGEIVDGRPPGDADVVLTLDATGDPVRVEVASAPTGPPLRLALDLVRIGEPVLIDLPGSPPPA